jgi:hypothetical protein
LNVIAYCSLGGGWFIIRPTTGREDKWIVTMSEMTVAIFRPYAFHVGQKIYIESGPRRGDWEVVGLGDRKVKLRCPISQREVEWDRFCYFVEENDNSPWPHPEH